MAVGMRGGRWGRRMGGGIRRRGHEGEDGVQGDGADEGEAVDLAAADFAAY